MTESPRAKRERHEAIAQAFRIWLATHPDSTRGERNKAFDAIADSFTPEEVFA